MNILRSPLLSLTAMWLLVSVHGVLQDPASDFHNRSNSCNPDELVVYRLHMDTHWSNESFPKQYPEWRPPAGWSILIGRTHDSSYQLFRDGEFASEGLQSFAENGRTHDLEQSVRDRRGIFDAFTAPAVSKGVGRTVANFFLDGQHSMVSVASKIVPSPDWFVGIDSLDLCKSGTWIDSIAIQVDPMDAGTDNGFTFTAPNWPSEPKSPVTRITSKSPNHPANSFYYPDLDQLPPIATMTFVKCSPQIAVEEDSDSDSNRNRREEGYNLTDSSNSAKSKGIIISEVSGLMNYSANNSENIENFSPYLGNFGYLNTSINSSVIGPSDILDRGNRTRRFTNTSSPFTTDDSIATESVVTPRSLQNQTDNTRLICTEDIYHDDTGRPLDRERHWKCRGRPRSDFGPFYVPDRRVVTATCNHTSPFHRWLSQMSHGRDFFQCQPPELLQPPAHTYQQTELQESLKSNERVYHLSVESRNSSQRDREVQDLSNDVGLSTAILDDNENSTHKVDTRRIKKSHHRRPQHCLVSSWTSWSACTVSCGVGDVIRTRKILLHPKRGGKPCPPLEEKRWCGGHSDCPQNFFNW